MIENVEYIISHDEEVDHFLKERGIIPLFGTITTQLSYDIITKIKLAFHNGKDKIGILINSEGGTFDGQVAIIDEILYWIKQGKIIETVVQGMACSGAANILLMGSPKYRYATYHSAIMFHSVSLDLQYDTIDNQKNIVDFTQRHQDLLNTTLLKNIKKRNGKQFLESIKKDLWMSANEAKKYGIIDHIIE